MSYAIRKDGLGWRAVNGADDVSPDEFFSDTIPGPTLAQVQEAQIVTLSTRCREQICAGFASSALGAVHSYPSATIDQQNMVQTAANSAGGALMCSNGGAWILTTHTQSQAQGVLSDFIIARDGARSKLELLTVKVNSCSDVADVMVVGW